MPAIIKLIHVFKLVRSYILTIRISELVSSKFRTKICLELVQPDFFVSNDMVYVGSFGETGAAAQYLKITVLRGVNHLNYTHRS